MSNIQFSLIKKHVLVFVALSSLSIILVIASVIFKHSQLDKELSLNTQIQLARQKIANIANDKTLINTYKSSYEELVTKGFLDEEERLTWIEQLEITAAKLELPDLRYQIDSQYELDQESYPGLNGVLLFVSRLTFETSLLHEGDLLALIAGLNALNSGLLVVDHCKLTRGESDEKEYDNKIVLDYNFHAFCDVSWYTSGAAPAPGLPIRGKI